MNNYKITKEAIKDWENVHTLDDIRLWHKIYTPWNDDKTLDEIIKVYEQRIKDPKPEDLLERTEFKNLWKISK